MISKRTRKQTGSVEQLKQGSFTIAKGINETASSLNTDTALYLKNLDVDSDGGLILRKPISALRVFPKVYGNIPTHVIPLHDDYTLVIYQKENRSAMGVIDSANCAIDVALEWVSYSTFTDTLINPTAIPKVSDSDIDGLNAGSIFETNFFKFDNITYANLSTNLLIYNVSVDFKNDVFDNTLANAELYGGEQWITRSLQIVYNASDNCVNLKILYTELSEIQFADGDLPLDANLALDNPYAIRDTYKQSLVSIKGILLYVPSVKTKGRISADVPFEEPVATTSLDNVHSVYPALNSSPIKTFSEAIQNPFYARDVKIVNGNAPDSMRTYINIPGTPYDEFKHFVRGGLGFCKIPHVQIDYAQDPSFAEVVFKDGVPSVEFATVSSPSAIGGVQYSFVFGAYRPLCDVSCNISNVDILKNTTEDVTRFVLSNTQFTGRFRLDIRYFNQTMREFFTKNIPTDVTVAGTEYHANVPEFVSKYAFPYSWTAANGDGTDSQFKNVIPTALALLSGFSDDTSGGIANWRTETLTSGTYDGMKRFIYDSGSNIYVVLAKYSQESTSTIIEDCFVFRIPNPYYNYDPNLFMSFGIQELKLQGVAKQNLTIHGRLR